MKQPRNGRTRRFWRRSLSLAATLWLTMGPAGGPSAPGETASANSGKRTAAYVYDRAGLSLRDADAAHLNQLNYSFALIQNGEVTGSHWQGIETFKRYIEKHPHILPVLAIGGWGADGFSQAASTAQGRTRFVQSTLSLMQRHGFLGVDIDWEYPGSTVAGIAASADDRENLTLLLTELRQGLDALSAADGKERLLGIAVGASASLIKHIDGHAVGALVDQVNLMTYDMQTYATASHHTALYAGATQQQSAASAVQSCIEAGFPREKIMLGAAFYARLYTLKSASGDALYASADSGSRSMTYTQLQTFLKDAQVYFDDAAKAPYAIKGTTFATYDDAQSIHYKGRYVLQQGLMGMMCWEYGGDDSGELLAAMSAGMR